MSFLKNLKTKCQKCINLNYKINCKVFILFKHFILILFFCFYFSTNVKSDEIKRKERKIQLQNQFDIVEVDSSTFNNKQGTCERFLACERRRIHFQNYGSSNKISCIHLLNQETEFGIQLKLRHKRRISSKRKMRACLKRIHKNIKKHAKEADNSKWPQVVVAGVGTFPASHLFPEKKQKSIPYGRMSEIEYELERNPTPSDVIFTDFSTDFPSTTTMATTSTPIHNSEENKKAELAIVKNLENERRRITRLLRVMTNSGLEEYNLNMPSDPPEWMTQFSNSLGYPHRPSQYMADHQPRGIFPATRRVQQKRKTAAAIKQLVGNNNKIVKKFQARKSFALPSWVNLTEMGILAARPHLAKLESWRLLNATKAANEKIQKQLASLSAKAFGLKNEEIKTNNNTKIIKTSRNTTNSFNSSQFTKTTSFKPIKSKVNKSASLSTSSTLPPTSLYNMKFTQIWTTKKRSEPTTTIKATLNYNITLKRNKNQEDYYSSLETVIDPNSWEDIDVLLPFTARKELSNSSSNKPNKKQHKLKTTTLLPQNNNKLNILLNNTKVNKLRHSGQAIMNQSLIDTPKKRVEITLESNKHKLNNQKPSNSTKTTILPSSFFSNLTKNHSHLSAAKTLLTSKKSSQKNQNNLSSFKKLINSSREELEYLKQALIKNLEKFLKNKKEKLEAENISRQKRLNNDPPAMLFYSKQDSERLGLNLNNCRLYIICKNYLGQLNSSCSSFEIKNNNSTKIKRRKKHLIIERCNSHILPLFKRAEMAKNKLEKEVIKCVENKIIEKNNKTKSLDKCNNSNWPLLTPFFPQLNCTEKYIKVQEHCQNLGKCCQNLQDCQNQINFSGLSKRIQIEKQRLKRRSEQCELQANEMFNNSLKERKKMLLVATSKSRHST